MKRSISMALMIVMAQALLLTVMAFAATTVDPPHYDVASGFVCTTCHTPHLSLGSTGYNNVCLSCHRPGEPAAGGRPLTLGDAADPFGTYTTASRSLSKKYQTSHRWDGSDTVPAAGAQPPIQTQMTTGNLRGRTSRGLACVSCHNQHSNTNGSFLRIANDRDQLCMDCHRSRNVQSHLKGSHPVGINYNTVQGNFNKPPVNATTSNTTSDLNGQLNKTGGVVLCSTCHGVHYTDSRSGTADGSANFYNLSTGDGHLLRTDRRGGKVDAGLADKVNICTNCHAGKRNHSLKGQDVQCDDCHGAHVEYDPNDPTGARGHNIFLVRRAVPKGVNGSGEVFFRYTGSTSKEYKNDQGTGVCQGCHAVPSPGGIYPSEHGSNDPKVCNICHYHNSSSGSFSGACDVCHGYPPTTATMGGPTGMALPATGATPSSPGAHLTHAKTSFMACNTCHTGYTAKPMPSKSIEIGFSISGSNFPGFAGSVNGGKFNGNVLNSGYSWSASTGTTLTTGNSAITCSVYCHGSALTGGTVAAPTWTNTDGSQKACGACHGVTASSAPTTGSHTRHAGNGAAGLAISCVSCHGAIGNNDHVNGSVNWDLSALTGSGLYKGVTAGGTGSIAPSASFGQCANVSCHSSGQAADGSASPLTYGTPTWGGSLNCGSCHKDMDTDSSAPGSHAAHAQAANISCSACHNGYTETTVNSATHNNGSVNLSFSGVAATTSYSQGAIHALGNGYSTCSATVCHGSGATPAWGANTASNTCTKCHGTGTVTVTSANRYVVAPGDAAATDTGKVSSNAKIGAHQTHLQYFNGLSEQGATADDRCVVCHGALPTSGSHANGSSIPVFQGLATRSGAYTASYNSGSCSVYCHNPAAATGGALNSANAGTGTSPLWTNASYIADGTLKTQANCGKCHKSPGDAGFTSTTAHSADITQDCSGCHGHNGGTGGIAGQQHMDGIKHGSGSCNNCHGYPPMPPAEFSARAAGAYVNAKVEDYAGGGGHHASHLLATVAITDGFTPCLPCHPSGTHNQGGGTVVKANINVNDDPADLTYRFDSGRAKRYTVATMSCSNISCHYQPTPRW
jgi:predicted CxxxxCH...CXXCH cytochrome family protein